MCPKIKFLRNSEKVYVVEFHSIKFTGTSEFCLGIEYFWKTMFIYQKMFIDFKKEVVLFSS